MFFWNSLAFSMIQWMLATWSLVPLPFLNPVWTSGSSWFTWCWSLAGTVLSMTLLSWEMGAIVRWLEHSLVLPFLGIGMRIDLFQSCGHCWVFQICWRIECNTWKESYDQPRRHIEKQRHYFVNKGPSTQGYAFSSGHVWIWELNYKESWMPKNWCFWTVVLEKTLESPLDCKEIQPVHPKGDQSWVFIGRTDAEAETPILWPPDAEPTHLKRPWCWEGLGARGEGDDRGWDGWMASLTQWTWVWASSGSRWWTGRPGVM